MFELEFPWGLSVVALPLIAYWTLPPYREPTASIRFPFFEDVARSAGLSPSAGAVVRRPGRVHKVVLVVCWLLFAMALARPQHLEPPIVKTEPARDILLCLDLSQSMDKQDFPGPDGRPVARIDAVKQVVSDFVRRRPDDRIGLVVFGDAPYPEAPFTLDHQTVQDLIDATLPGMAGPQTALGDSIGLAIRMFENSKASEKVAIILTDGNDTASRMPPRRAADIAKSRSIVLHTIGIGDRAATGEERLDAPTLQAVAEATGGSYFFGGDQAQLEAVYRTLDAITPSNARTLSWQPKRELFMVPLGAGLLILLAFHFVGAIRRRPSRLPEAG